MIIKIDDLYARAWECDYERPIFDADDDKTAPPHPPGIAERSNLPPEEMLNTPGTSRDFFPEIFQFNQPTDYQTKRIPISIRNVTQTWAWNSITLSLPTPIVHNTTYVNPKPNCNDDYRF